MKTMVLQFMLEGPRPCTILCVNVHTTVKYLNKNASIAVQRGSLKKLVIMQDVFVIEKTRLGKSLVFQAAPMVFDAVKRSNF